MPRRTACSRRKLRNCVTPDGGCLVHADTRRCRTASTCAQAHADDCEDGQVPGCVWRKWNARAKRRGCYPPLRAVQAPATAAVPRLAPVLVLGVRRVISFALFWGEARGVGYGGQRHRMREYAYGLWHALQVARAAHWEVVVYHDGTVENVLMLFRLEFKWPLFRCVYVRGLTPTSLHRFRYLGSLFRLLPADDPTVGVFLVRDLDDLLTPAALAHVEQRWLSDAESLVHVQRERFSAGGRSALASMAWFGQKRRTVAPTQAPRVATVIEQWVTGGRRRDRYGQDNVFLSVKWIPRLQQSGHAGVVTPLKSSGLVRSVPPASQYPAQFRYFIRQRVPMDPDHRKNTHTMKADQVVRLRL